MALQRVCDRCKKTIGEGANPPNAEMQIMHYKATGDVDFRGTVELCQPCYLAVKKVIGAIDDAGDND